MDRKRNGVGEGRALKVCEKCGRQPALYSNPLFGGHTKPGDGYYEVECECGERSGRFARAEDAVVDWNQDRPVANRDRSV